MKTSLLIVLALALYTTQFEILKTDIGLKKDRGVSSLYQSTKDSDDLLSKKEDVHFEDDFEFSGPTIALSKETDQKIEGFGGAFTEASGVVFQGLSKENQEKMIEMYFDAEKGIGYTLGRVPVGACDFSPNESFNWSYADVEGDVNLEHFDTNATQDKKAVIPLIELAVKKIKETSKNVFKLFAAPWSPPAWMKTTGRMTGDGMHNGGKLMRKYWSVMADYLVKWVGVYKSLGLDIWALTPQNEPEGPWEFETCMYGPDEMANWIGYHLGPKMKKAHPEVHILTFDHNKNNVFEWTQAMYDHPAASKYVSGTAFHWYQGDYFNNVAKSHAKVPDAILLPSEATWEGKNFPKDFNFKDGAWSLGEGYGHDVMGDLNHGANGWTDWNLLLDITGGPNHINNFCDATMIADGEELHVHPQFYYQGHYSKFLTQGSIRVKHEILNSTKYTGEERRPYGTCTSEDGLEATAFKRPDGKMAVVVMNCGDDAIHYKLKGFDHRSAKVNIPGHSIQTLVFGSEKI